MGKLEESRGEVKFEVSSWKSLPTDDAKLAFVEKAQINFICSIYTCYKIYTGDHKKKHVVYNEVKKFFAQSSNMPRKDNLGNPEQVASDQKMWADAWIHITTHLSASLKDVQLYLETMRHMCSRQHQRYLFPRLEGETRGGRTVPNYAEI